MAAVVVMRVSELLGSVVRTESGHKLGHVYDVRVERDPRASSEHAGQRWHVKGVVVGERGMLERFGVVGAKKQEPLLKRDVVPWSAILSTRAGEVVVKDGTKPQ
jgi:sporulation protein YlmC with PRC-barrel domain